MRSLQLLVVTATTLILPGRCVETLPFSPPIHVSPDDNHSDRALRLLKRQDNCPIGYDSCSSNEAVCCPSDTTCTWDFADNIACCRTSAVCTGTIETETGGSSSSSTGFQFPEPTSASATTTDSDSEPEITGTTVPDAPYPFVFIPTSFPNSATCMSYYSQCESQLTACITSLGGVNGVTVAGDGGGVTVPGAAPAVPSAQSVCSSLRREACYGLRPEHCSAFGAADPDDGFIAGDDASRRKSSLHDVIVAVVAGIVGMFI